MRNRPSRRLAAANPVAAGGLAGLSSGRLRGHVDSLAFGKGFVHVQGWVCAADGTQIAQPVTVGLCGQTLAGYGLSHRADLEAAGIAGGLAALNAVVPITSCAQDTGHEVILADADGSACSLYCPPERVGMFLPSGFIDHVGPTSVTGWLFDPGAGTPAGSQLLLNEDWAADIDSVMERYDLTFDVGNGQRAFGFECAADVISDAMRRRRHMKGRVGLLGLASSGWLVAEVKIRLLDDRLVSEAPELVPPRRIVTSDCLTKMPGLSVAGSNAVPATTQTAQT